MIKLIYALIVAGTAVTNSTAETVAASYSLPAYALQPGKVYGWRGSLVATAQQSTDTLTVRLRVGPTTLTGTVCATTGAIDPGTADVIVWDVELTCRAVGTTGVVVLEGTVSTIGAEGTATQRVAFEQLALNNAAANLLEVTAQWSVAASANSCRVDSFKLTESQG